MSKGGDHRRQRQLDTAVATIQRRYGPWSLVKGKQAASAGEATAIPHIPTGFPHLDRALGIGGLPKGRLCEIVGPATSGKTTLALKLLSQAQAGGGLVGYIDQALYFDPDYAHRAGVDLSRLLVGTPQSLKETLAMAEALVRRSGLAALVVDALDLLWTDAEAAAPLAATLNRLPAPLDRSATILIVLRESLSAHSPALSALAHLAAVRLQISRERWIQRRGDVRGYEARVEVLKNRMGPAGRVVPVVIEFNGTVHGDGL